MLRLAAIVAAHMQSCSVGRAGREMTESRRNWDGRGTANVLCCSLLLPSALEGGALTLDVGFLPGPGHASAVLTFSPHFTEFIAR